MTCKYENGIIILTTKKLKRSDGMKIKFSLAKKEASLEADVEGIVKQNIQNKTERAPKKTKYQIRQEERRRNKEIEQKHFLQSMGILVGMLVVCFLVCIIGVVFGG